MNEELRSKIIQILQKDLANEDGFDETADSLYQLVVESQIEVLKNVDVEDSSEIPMYWMGPEADGDMYMVDLPTRISYLQSQLSSIGESK